MKYILSIEGGGTKTSAGFYDIEGRLIQEAEGGPSNPVSCGIEASLRAVVDLALGLIPADTQEVVLAVAMAGAFDGPMRRRLAERLCGVLPVVKAVVAGDLHPLLYANAREQPGILALAGTGATVLGQDAGGHTAQAGGRGAAFGDEGSAYRIALDALRAAAYAVDGLGPETALVEALPQCAGVSDFFALTPWANAARKQDLAALAQAVGRCADEGDEIARLCIEDQARRLAQQVLAVQQKLDLDEQTPVFMAGGVFEKNALFRVAFESALDSFTGLRAQFPRIRGHAAAALLAQADAELPWLAIATQDRSQTALPATEQGLAGVKTLDEMTVEELCAAMNGADAEVAGAVAAQQAPIAQAIEWAAEAIRNGGRIVYIGAGTSGRLGVLDASECPPTFGSPPERVLGVIAGGEAALRTSVEGVEDDRELGRLDMKQAAPATGDVVVGIAASGTTPYTRAALEEAKARGARTVLLCCNPAVREGADCVIAINTGPEVLAGSTRLKAGTACKMVLNMISTGAFAQAGFVKRGLMVNMRPVNAKLRDRAVRIVAELAGVDAVRARQLLEKAAWRIGAALELAKA